MRTEDVSPRYEELDAWSSLDALHAMLEGQLAAVSAVRPALSAMAMAGDEAAARLARGGRLVYCGAGTSGRIGVQDGAELSPTFDWPEARTLFVMAGGERALMRSSENAEDNAEAGRTAMVDNAIAANDVVIALAASGTTPFAIACLDEARTRGALTIGIANNAGAPLLEAAEHPILIETGPEVLAGSTRMKAGTAQKVVLNLLSTLIMVRLGRVYRGLMVDMRARNAKLERRAAAMVVRLSGCSPEMAVTALTQAGGALKAAVLIAGGLDPAEAATALDRHDGNLRAALAAQRP